MYMYYVYTINVVLKWCTYIDFKKRILHDK